MNIIAAIARNGVIGNGKDNQLPWHYPSDLSHFKTITQGAILISGRRTFESLPIHPLPGRKHIVLTHQPDIEKNNHPPHPEIAFATMETLESTLATFPPAPIFVIGGASIYEHFLPTCERLWITHIHEDHEGDVTFPLWNPQSFRKTTLRHDGPLEFALYQRSS